MNVVRKAAAGLVALLGCTLAVFAVIAFAAGGIFWVACVYALFALLLVAAARRLRPPRRRYVFARH